MLLVTTVAGVLLLPQSRWFHAIRAIGVSTLYLENWVLAADSVDYHFSDYVRAQETCSPVVGNVLAYMDHNHPSAPS